MPCALPSRLIPFDPQPAESPTIRDLHRLALAIGVAPDILHDVLHEWSLKLFGVPSMRDLDPAQRHVIAARLQSYRHRPSGKPGPPGRPGPPRPPRPHRVASRSGTRREPGTIVLCTPKQRALINTIADKRRWTKSMLDRWLTHYFEFPNVDSIPTSRDGMHVIRLLLNGGAPPPIPREPEARQCAPS